MTDNITTDDTTPDLVSLLEQLLAAVTEEGEALARGLTEIAASVTRPNVGA